MAKGLYAGLLRTHDGEYDNHAEVREALETPGTCHAHPGYKGWAAPTDRSCIQCARVFNHAKMKAVVA